MKLTTRSLRVAIKWPWSKRPDQWRERFDKPSKRPEGARLVNRNNIKSLIPLLVQEFNQLADTSGVPWRAAYKDSESLYITPRVGNPSQFLQQFAQHIKNKYNYYVTNVNPRSKDPDPEAPPYYYPLSMDHTWLIRNDHSFEQPVAY
jgi:hypothetical protein